jgi:hypothetical protein
VGWLARQVAGSGVAIDQFRIAHPVSPACARSLVAAFRRHRIVIAHSHGFSMAVYGAWASWYAGVPHVITMHGSATMRRVSSVVWGLAPRLRSAAGRLPRRAACPVRSATISASRSSGPRPIANGVRHVRVPHATLRDELGLASGDRLLVSVGNLYPVKAFVRTPHPHM